METLTTELRSICSQTHVITFVSEASHFSIWLHNTVAHVVGYHFSAADRGLSMSPRPVHKNNNHFSQIYEHILLKRTLFTEIPSCCDQEVLSQFAAVGGANANVQRSHLKVSDTPAFSLRVFWQLTIIQ